MASKKENPFKYGSEPELNRIFDSLVDLQDRVAREFAKAEKIAGFDESVSFLPVKDAVLSLPNYRELYEPQSSSTWGPKTRNKLEDVDAKVLLAIAENKANVLAIEAENVAAFAHNTKIAERVKEIMTRLGVTPNYTTYEYPTSRSRTKKSITHTAGYITDLARVTPKSNTTSMQYRIQEYERDYARWLIETREAEKRARIEKDNETVNTKILGNPRLVATLMQASVNILDEVQKAVPGKKAEVIQYCLSTAIHNTITQDKYVAAGYFLLMSYKTHRDSTISKNYACQAVDKLKMAEPTSANDSVLCQGIEKEINNWRSGHRFYDGADCSIDSVFDQSSRQDLVKLVRELEDLHNEI